MDKEQKKLLKDHQKGVYLQYTESKRGATNLSNRSESIRLLTQRVKALGQALKFGIGKRVTRSEREGLRTTTHKFKERDKGGRKQKDEQQF